MSEQPTRQTGLETGACWVQSLGSNTLRQCSLFRVSSRGAIICSQAALPDTFNVFFALSTDVRQRCRVITRSDREVEVEFIDAAEG